MLVVGFGFESLWMHDATPHILFTALLHRYQYTLQAIFLFGVNINILGKVDGKGLVRRPATPAKSFYNVQ